MATGGVVTRPTLALIGEGTESEAVLPLSVLGSMLKSAIQTTADSIAARFSGQSGSTPGTQAAAGTGGDQIINFYQPVQSPAETARAIRNINKDSGFAMG